EAAKTNCTKNFLGRAELRQQPLEISRTLDPAAQLIREHRLCRTWRPNHQYMAGRQQRAQRSIDEFRAFKKEMIQFVADGGQFSQRLGNHALQKSSSC